MQQTVATTSPPNRRELVSGDGWLPPLSAIAEQPSSNVHRPAAGAEYGSSFDMIVLDCGGAIDEASICGPITLPPTLMARSDAHLGPLSAHGTDHHCPHTLLDGRLADQTYFKREHIRAGGSLKTFSALSRIAGQTTGTTLYSRQATHISKTDPALLLVIIETVRQLSRFVEGDELLAIGVEHSSQMCRCDGPLLHSLILSMLSA
jgi:hypothetical protein